MTTMQWIGLGLGAVIVLVRFPGILWPEAYKTKALALLEGYPNLVRALGVLAWGVAIAILVLVAETLTIQQRVMLVIAVLFVATGVVAVFFPEVYRRLADRAARTIGNTGVRVVSVVSVLVGLWIVYLSFSVR